MLKCKCDTGNGLIDGLCWVSNCSWNWLGELFMRLTWGHWNQDNVGTLIEITVLIWIWVIECNIRNKYHCLFMVSRLNAQCFEYYFTFALMNWCFKLTNENDQQNLNGSETLHFEFLLFILFSLVVICGQRGFALLRWWSNFRSLLSPSRPPLSL